MNEKMCSYGIQHGKFCVPKAGHDEHGLIIKDVFYCKGELEKACEACEIKKGWKRQLRLELLPQRPWSRPNKLQQGKVSLASAGVGIRALGNESENQGRHVQCGGLDIQFDPGYSMSCLGYRLKSYLWVDVTSKQEKK